MKTEELIKAKKYIEPVIGTIKHDGHLGRIQTEWIFPDLEKVLAAIRGDMNKYYVCLISLIDNEVVSHYLWKDLRFYPGFEKPEYSFTMEQIRKIGNGALIANKLVMLVPVEDGE